MKGNSYHHNQYHGVGGSHAYVIEEQVVQATYEFQNFFHPYVDKILEMLNKGSLKGLMDPEKLASLASEYGDEEFFQDIYDPHSGGEYFSIKTPYPEKEIELEFGGAYSVYNWELFFHIPLLIAVHLSKNQRFAEAQRWFHFIFDPTSTDDVEGSERFWKFLYFRQHPSGQQIQKLLNDLSALEIEGEEEVVVPEKLQKVLHGYDAIMDHPFQPHMVARTRPVSYQYQVVMKYLDNLIAWGDSLFRQDTIETINEATQLYVLAANILGPRPQELPRMGTSGPKTYNDINHADPLSNFLVDLESEFPFNLGQPPSSGPDAEASSPLFGIGRTIYFCIPKNDNLLTYWDLVADRLFKIRHCMNIEGVVRQLPLFQPPIDPGMLVRAAAAGIDISSLVSGLNQPLLPVRSRVLIDKALELVGEVKTMGKNLLETLEKRDREQLALLKQAHEIKVRELALDVRHLEWKQAEATTESLMRARELAFQQFRHYQLLLGKEEKSFKAIKELTLERKEMDAEIFDEVYEELIGQYAQAIELEALPPRPKAGSSPKSEAGATGKGVLNLLKSEAAELNEHFPGILDKLEKTIEEGLDRKMKAMIPDFTVSKAPQGVGETTKISGGAIAYAVGKILMDKIRAEAFKKEHKAIAAGKTAQYERRSEDWILQSNLAATRLMEFGRQIIASLIREQIVRHEYNIHQKQIEQSEEIDAFLHDKFTNEELYGWMQGELSKLFYEYYKLAFDTAKKAERAMKHELMRPELDERQFIQFNYWDGGRKGLLSGEALFLDLQRMETAFLEYNKREYEIVKHIKLNDIWENEEGAVYLFNLPEYLFDADYPGHYLRRIKHARLTVGEGAEAPENISCTLTLLSSELRRSPLLDNGNYGRQGTEDSRFIDYYGPVQSIVTSSGKDDGGLFELDWKDERFLPFEGAGAISSWRISFPESFSLNGKDVVLHLYYTAREGGEVLKDAARGS
ncbi:MAG: hypothetical protein KDD02_18805 [Phaeodactylibacter sp.]|nr:hypothetical protein [Phaeodactylibacter sp.]